MTNRASVLWKILKGLAKKWPEMVIQWTIVTTRLGETVFMIKDVNLTKRAPALKFFHSKEENKLAKCQ